MNRFNYEIEWYPSDEVIKNSNLYKILSEENLSYDDFIRKSAYDYEWFWRKFFEDINFVWEKEFEKVIDISKSREFPSFFVGGKLNISKNCLDYNDLKKIALISESESGTVRIYTYEELLKEVNKLSNALLELGIKEGDRVAIYLPFIPEVAISILSISRIGAIAVPLFSGFSEEPIKTRINISNAKAVITADGFRRRNKIVYMKDILDKALLDCPSVEKVIIYKNLNTNISLQKGRDYYWDEICKVETFQAKAFDSETPLMIIYTSGTTGRPKGALHVHGGFPIKSAQDMFHVFDIKQNDIITWITDIGWMMGPWLIFGSLINRATMFMYDGAIDFPDENRIFELVDKHKISILGISPTIIRSIMSKSSPKNYSLKSLRIIGSTGEPWNIEPWRWTLKNIGKNKVPIINYSGGTEISGGILCCVIIRGIKPMSFNSVNPGIDADIFDENGISVKNEIGYLVVKNLNPGMTRGFYMENDRYIETYWSKYKDVWYHGDLAYVDEDGFYYILGRADDTLKIAGKRIGPAEIESIISEYKLVKESAVIGIPDEIKGQVPVAFVVLRENSGDVENIKKEIMQLVIEKIGKAFALKEVYFVSDLPKTRNAKIMRRVIKSIYLNEPLGDISSLVNPECLEEIKSIIS
ncbi:MAG: AMP-binding protein [candidate division WOR-3 bacterium]|nr:AMP-binding protein [candidate division WOR-3 bacterium]MDW8150081.1 AMP-binding protein [candidate division WOR-3 bacterium]